MAVDRLQPLGLHAVVGDVDLIAMVRVREHDEIASVVADRLNKVPGVTRTETHIAFRAYSKHDLEAAFGAPVLEAYGMTEAAPMITFTRPGQVLIGSAGTAMTPAGCSACAPGRFARTAGCKPATWC